MRTASAARSVPVSNRIPKRVPGSLTTIRCAAAPGGRAERAGADVGPGRTECSAGRAAQAPQKRAAELDGTVSDRRREVTPQHLPGPSCAGNGARQRCRHRSRVRGRTGRGASRSRPRARPRVGRRAVRPPGYGSFGALLRSEAAPRRIDGGRSREEFLAFGADRAVRHPTVPGGRPEPLSAHRAVRATAGGGRGLPRRPPVRQPARARPPPRLTRIWATAPEVVGFAVTSGHNCWRNSYGAGRGHHGADHRG